MDLLIDSGISLLKVILPFIILSAILSLSVRHTQKLLFQLIGWFAYPVVYVSVPIHELTHMLMAMLFTHRIEKVKLLQLVDEDGVIGYVSTSIPRSRFKSRALYMRIGQFFVGIAPIMLACIGLAYLTDIINPEYFNQVLENPKSIFEISGIIILILIMFNFSMFNLSDLDFKSILKGTPYLLVTLYLIMVFLNAFESLTFITKAMLTVQTNMLIILVVATILSIGMTVVLSIISLFKRN